MTGTAPERTGPTAAIVLAGGRAARLGGVDKAALEIGGRTLLARVLDAVAAAGINAARTVVVGGEGALPDGVRRTREEPPFGGPLAALGAGLTLLTDRDAPEVLVLACDLPRAASLVALLPAEVPAGADGTVVRDSGGREQWLAARYRTAALREAVSAVAATSATGLTGLPLRAAVGRLRLVRVDDVGGASLDVDTPADLARARATMDAPSSHREDAS
ncbi:molybdenum cofactor guanylyltransferase [Serinibacter arcticus]|uniref:Molybdopterin-guanine dinucleotide biosynthesis protein MobA n=1 Tax=Serinibacter arcticus TaxID=1655435 RepID=A0A4Z1E3D9_9MICO|nr:NTP transferase domain-containing protein [Serinibacter arcticus]TGO05272.1 Molybdopterin-guanine dinucleotide biosynthesis protein MobA [Serinibacter arcticus]